MVHSHSISISLCQPLRHVAVKKWLKVQLIEWPTRNYTTHSSSQPQPNSLLFLPFHRFHSLSSLSSAVELFRSSLIGAMADLLVDPIIEKLIETGFHYLKDQFRWQTGMKEELKRLQEKLPKIQAIVHYASGQYLMKDKNPALNKWLWQLRESIDEADDVLDEFEYLKLKEEQLTRDKERTKLTKTKKLRKMRSIMRSVKERLVKVLKRALKIDSTLKRLEEVVHKLDEVFSAHDVTIFFHLVKEEKQDHQEQQLELYRARETGSLPKNEQIGRDREKEFVINWLSKTSNEDQAATAFYSNISLLSVVGQGGMGKTTLLQHAYNDESTKFDLKMWACVSNNFDVKRVIADMLESVEKDRSRLESLNALQKTLQSKVNSQKFLLVLDDIWEKEEDKKELNKSKWENVLAPLASGKLGSKIILTTRMESVASMLSEVIHRKNDMLKLEGLKDEECLDLLKKYAFANVENPNLHQNLWPIAEKMVKKLSGSPLAARVIGGVLNSYLDESHWMRVLDHGIGNHNDILLILKLSYIFLPKFLRNCLAFCCTFPQDYEFNKDDLVRMWISLGFIQPPSIRGETMMDVGKRYFDILVRKSLLDRFENIYKLHDLIHEMLRAVSAQQYFSIVNEIVGDEEPLLRDSETIRHLFVQTNNFDVLRKVEKFKNLRSFILDYSGRDEDFVVVLAKIFKTSRSIRLIYIRMPRKKIGLIPAEIGHLLHLRYLQIYGCVTHLPVSLSNLYHLKFMVLNHSCFHIFLPRDLNNLHNLFYLKLSFPGMLEIGKISSLQELNSFSVQNEAGYRFEELEHMNELRVLNIYFHENLNDANDAYNAKLQDKRNLIDLSLQWSYQSINAVDGLNENVIDNLQPHSSLKKLKIINYMGVKPAIWMNNVHLISNLEYIKLENCSKWQTLPPFWQLPFLKYLHLEWMDEVKGFDYTYLGIDEVRVFPSLQVLSIHFLRALENLFVATAASYECLFPCLIEMDLYDCPNLQELPSLPPKLEKLEINEVGWKGSNWLQGITNYCTFSIYNCPNLITLKGHQEMKTTDKCQLILSELVINDPSMLPMVPLTSVTSIQKLVIEKNDVVISFPFEADQWFLQVSSSLCELTFNSLKSLQSLPSSLESLSSLEILRVQEVPLLQLLPNMPISLKQLKLVKLISLLSIRSLLESLSSLIILHVEEVSLLHQLPNMPSLEQLMLKNFKSQQPLPSSLVSLSSLKILHVEDIPLLKLLPNMPAFMEELKLVKLEYIQSLPSSLESLSSLKILHVEDIPLLQLLPNMPASMEELKLVKLKYIQSLPSSLESLSSLKILHVEDIPLLQLLPNMSASLEKLKLKNLESMQSLPSSWESLTSLKILHLEDIPSLQLLPNMPASMEELKLVKLKYLQSLPCSLESLSSLKILHVEDIPLLQLLPSMPSSMQQLMFEKLESLRSLPSLESLSSLGYLLVKDIPQLQFLPNMPASLERMKLVSLESLQCLPSFVSITFFDFLILKSIPLLQQLPDLSPMMLHLHIENCHPELKERYRRYTGSDWQKIAHIPVLSMD